MLENHKEFLLQMSQSKSSNLAYKKRKEASVKSITKWLTESHNKKEIVFSDEKRFSLYSHNSWYTFVKANEANIRQISNVKVVVF